jgi:hypothetical protein
VAHTVALIVSRDCQFLSALPRATEPLLVLWKEYLCWLLEEGEGSMPFVTPLDDLLRVTPSFVRLEMLEFPTQGMQLVLNTLILPIAHL